MGKQNTLAMVEGRKALLVKNNDKKEMLAYLAPQKIVDGKVYNFKGNIIAGIEDAEDQELNAPTALDDATRVTQALVERLFKPMMLLLGDVTDDAPAEEPKAEKKAKKAKKEKVEDEPKDIEEAVAEVEDDGDDEPKTTKEFIKELKAELKGLEKGTKEYKKLKKQIKKLKGE